MVRWPHLTCLFILILSKNFTARALVKSHYQRGKVSHDRRLLAVNARQHKSRNEYNEKIRKKKGYGGKWRSKSNPRIPRKPGQTDSGFFDVRRLTPGNVVEYTNAKGSRRVVLINKRLGTYLEVTNDVSKIFTIPVNRVNYLVEGDYAFEDLRNLSEIIQNLGPAHIERVYNNLTGTESFANSFREGKAVAYTLEYIGNILHPLLSSGNNDGGGLRTYKAGEEGNMQAVSNLGNPQQLSEPARIYVAFRLLGLYGSVFFDAKNTDTLQEGCIVHGLGLGTNAATAANHNFITVYLPLEPAQVSTNMQERAALQEFKAWYKLSTNGARTQENGNFERQPGSDSRSNVVAAGASQTRALAAGSTVVPSLPERVIRVVNSYAGGLKQIVIQRHPWVLQGWARKILDEAEAAKGRELLEVLGLAPSAKNARKVLEVGGIWKPHFNVEKYVMDIRDEYPSNVLAEARYLVENYERIADTDERIRRDMRHLGAYAIDREGAAEVDDAVSIEYLDNGREKLWIHIADVSRWVRPGSKLSLEAEKRMTSLYMPDERISMFPEILTTELLSLGAMTDSYALSCGVTLNEEGEVDSYEVCPSRVRITQRLSYQQLDDILAAQNITLDRAESLSLDDNGQSSSRLSESEMIAFDLGRLYWYALLRNRRRIENDGALDDMLRHKTELTLVVRERDVGGGSKARGNSYNSINGRQDSGRDERAVGGGFAHSQDGFVRNTRSSELGLRKKSESPPVGVIPRTKMVVNGYTSWSNASSVSLVSEYMVLMCQVMGKMCSTNNIPVWYKTQEVFPALSMEDLQLKMDENLFLRSARVISHLRSANDSRVPGLHATTGSQEYVQCTSPIRRYHDLYNHYRLKAAMHAASLGADYEDRAQEEAGITMLDQMATAEERLQTLIACRRVTRHREGYWMRLYMEKLCNIVNPRCEFDVMVSTELGPYTEELWDQCLFTHSGSSFSSWKEQDKSDLEQQALSESPSREEEEKGEVSEALIMQLGTFKPYLLYSKKHIAKGQSLRCHLYKQYTNPATYILTPVNEPLASLPSLLRDRLLSGKGKEDTFVEAFNRRGNRK